jgi:hypothetical protein
MFFLLAEIHTFCGQNSVMSAMNLVSIAENHIEEGGRTSDDCGKRKSFSGLILKSHGWHSVVEK